MQSTSSVLIFPKIRNNFCISPYKHIRVFMQFLPQCIARSHDSHQAQLYKIHSRLHLMIAMWPNHSWKELHYTNIIFETRYGNLFVTIRQRGCNTGKFLRVNSVFREVRSSARSWASLGQYAPSYHTSPGTFRYYALAISGSCYLQSTWSYQHSDRFRQLLMLTTFLYLNAYGSRNRFAKIMNHEVHPFISVHTFPEPETCQYVRHISQPQPNPTFHIPH